MRLSICIILSFFSLNFTQANDPEICSIQIFPENKASVNTLLQEVLTKSYSSSPQSIQLEFHEGTYYINEPIIISGLDRNVNIVFKAFENQQVFLSGSEFLGEGLPVNEKSIIDKLPVDAQKNILQIKIPEQILKSLKITMNGPEFQFINGQKLLKVSQYPLDNQWLYIDKVEEAQTKVNLRYKSNTPFVKSSDGNMYMYGYWNRTWYGDYQLVDNWDPSNKELIVPKTSKHGYGTGFYFRMFNLIEHVDEPGKMYIDFDKGVLYFWPEDGRKVYINSSDKNIFIICNSKNIFFRHLQIGENKAPAFKIENSENVSIEFCHIRNIVSNAISIEGGKNCGAKNCEIENTGAAAIVLRGGDRNKLVPAGHYVEFSHIHSFARIVRTYQPAVYLEGVGNRVSHCYIHDAPHQGIMIKGNDHIIENNEFTDLAQESGDVGAVYSGRDWTYRGNIIRSNYFHDLKGVGDHGAVGVYIDDLASGFVISGNIFYRCTKAVQLGGGRDNNIENNIFIECDNLVKLDNRGEKRAKIAAAKDSWKMVEKLNAVPYSSEIYRLRYPELANIMKNSPYSPLNNRVTNNIYLKDPLISIKPLDDNYWSGKLVVEGNIKTDVKAGLTIKEMVGTLNSFGEKRQAQFIKIDFLKIEKASWYK